MLYDRTHTRKLDELGGLASVMPWLTGALLFTMFASAGLPGLNNFVGEFLVIMGTFLVSRWLAVIAATGVILVAIYLLWSYQRVAFGPLGNESHRRLRDVGLLDVTVLIPILALLLVFGVYPQPLTERIEPATRTIIQRVDPDHVTDVSVVQALESSPSTQEASQ
jgi:NADH-quinone oxidoreductase subunit M